MHRSHRYLLHTNGPALWPAHKPLTEVLELQATTPQPVWEATYQGNPTPPGGVVFQRSWWRHSENRFTPGELRRGIGRYISWDTGLKDKEKNAFSVGIVGEILADYRLAIIEVRRDRLTFPDLPEAIEAQAHRWRGGDLLKNVIIEDKASGTSAYQTLLASTTAPWLAPILFPFQPGGGKTQRAQQAAVWCKNGSVLLPHPGDAVPWLLDLEDELFTFPGSTWADQVDALSQLVLFTEAILAEGWRSRQ